MFNQCQAPLLIKYVFSILLSVFFFCLSVSYAKEKDYTKTIVIDPGHGGYDVGAKGIENSLEKTIALTLARILESALANKYTVILTRTDDFWLNLPERTAKANHSKADLFISIHNSGSFLHQGDGISIFYYKNDLGNRPLDETSPLKPAEENSSLILWSDTQKNHMKSSIVLCDSLQKSLADIEGVKIRIIGAPLYVLAGAEMPAVLIEIGYLTSPVEEKKMNDANYLTHLARTISGGIEGFFQNRSTFIN